MGNEHDDKDQDDLLSPLLYLLVSSVATLMTLLLRCLFCPGEQFWSSGPGQLNDRG